MTVDVGGVQLLSCLWLAAIAYFQTSNVHQTLLISRPSRYLQPRAQAFIVMFLRATAVPAGTAERVLATAILSVCLGCHDPVPNQAQDSGFIPYDSLESLVFNMII